MHARVSAQGPGRRARTAAALALTALVSAPLLYTSVSGQSAS